ncbi:universal stress protein [Nitrosococcus watsonii]|uniref:UspA domain protein n=1 Tax=Nitrosococcus watsoni (strain C-113) TaxID=105559 RepID=D8K5A4_NITWC|nr:universal stress protein [Nitrosococcus watsonii]ADJ28081.1 UspA domain protein [Nitrosococcus watsonii C-113]
MARRQRVLIVLNPNELDSQPEPALERGVFIARETNAFLELFASEYHPSFTPLIGKPSQNEWKPETYIRFALSRLQEISEMLIQQEQLDVSVDAAWNRHQYDGVMEKISRIKPDLIIKSTRHDNQLNRTFFNYADWHLIRNCPCPLMLAKSEDRWETRTIVACVEPSHLHGHMETLDSSIIETAQELAYRLRGELHIFHAIEFMPEPIFRLWQPGSSYKTHKKETRQKHEALLNKLLRPYGIGTQRVHVFEGGPAETLLSFAQEIKASLVVMGAVSKGTLGNLLIGNTAEKVLDSLRCDILVVKSNPLEAKELNAELVFG